MQLSDHFSLAELEKSDIAARNNLDNSADKESIEYLTLLCKEILEPVREHYGVPFSPSSGYRSEALCVLIGSSAKSQHAKGQAADFEVPGVDNYNLATWIEANLNFDQLILECYTKGDPHSGWVHCSISDEPRHDVLTYTKKAGYEKGLIR
jgi:zinc D-Ala-D-Ala carboxypeptidase